MRRFTERRAPGAYLRVVESGRIAAGASVEVVRRPGHGVTIEDVFPLRLADRERLRRLLHEGEGLEPELVAAVEDELRRDATRAPAPAAGRSA